MSDSSSLFFQQKHSIPLESLDTVLYGDTPSSPFAVVLKNQDEILTYLDVSDVLESSASSKRPLKFKFEHKGHIRSLKVSPDKRFFGVLRSAKVLEIRYSGALATDVPILHVVRDDKSSDAILGFEWIIGGDFVCIGSKSVDLFHFHENKRIFTCKKSLHYKVLWYRYDSFSKVLLLSSPSPNLLLFRLGRDSARGPSIPLQLTQKHVSFISLYQRLYVMITDLWRLNPVLSVYRITNVSSNKVVDLPLSRRGEIGINVYDNLLIVHHWSVRKSFVFDIFSSTPEVPLATEPIPFEDSVSDEHEGSPSSSIDNIIGIPDIRCYSPNYLMKGSIIFELHFDVCSLRIQLQQRKDIDAIDLLQTLLRRSGKVSQMLRFEVLYEMILARKHLPLIRKMYDMLNASATKQKKRSLERSPSELSVSSRRSFIAAWGSSNNPHLSDSNLYEQALISMQEEMYTNVFVPYSRQTTCSREYFVGCILEYMESIHSLNCSLQPMFHELFVKTLLELERHHEILQHMQNGIIGDTIPIAQWLSQTSSTKLISVSIEMFQRLECHEEIIDVMLQHGRIEEALDYAIAHDCMGTISAEAFLEAAVSTGNSVSFLNTYRCMEEYGKIPLSTRLSLEDAQEATQHDHFLLGDMSTPTRLVANSLAISPTYGFSGQNGVGRFISIYREIWGPTIELENLTIN